MSKYLFIIVSLLSSFLYGSEAPLLKERDQSWYQETLHPDWGQQFHVKEVVLEQKTDNFDLIIFENETFGRVMALDGAIQTTQKDEFVYHEMLAHVPLFAHRNPKKVLIVGGGDGGLLREVCRHDVEAVTLIEIDASVIEMSKKYFPCHSKGAFEDPRVCIKIQDGALFVKETTEKFDVILVDSTDPIGPGAVLFTQEFYADCSRCLNENGILVNQNGVPFLQGDEVTQTYQKLITLFKDTRFFVAAIPTYCGGLMTLGWATNDEKLKDISLSELQEKFEKSKMTTHYYNPESHLGSFYLPQYIKDLMIPSSR